MNKKKVAVILSGCGVYDGSEINEVVLSLLALEENNLTYQCFSPNINQHHVINHLTGEVMAEKRNMLVESARIVRGKISPINEFIIDDFAALLVPGGFGVAKNLSDFAFKGAEVHIQEEVMAVFLAFKEKMKPAGYVCIAPALLGKIYGAGVILTVGNDENTISAISAMGAEHRISNVGEIVVDDKNRVVTTAAYMLAKNILDAKLGIDKLIKKLHEMI